MYFFVFLCCLFIFFRHFALRGVAANMLFGEGISHSYDAGNGTVG